MPVRRGDPARLLAAVNAQLAALGRPEWSGPVTVDALETACVGAVLAAIDLNQEAERDATRWAVVHLLGLLARQAPGRAVEVRIPPHAAIQCVAGPRHTRGTPPNVVETDAITWILLATGRLSWAEALAAGRVRASGPRSDLSEYLPLVAAAR
jgi:Bacterial SCP ortholog